jgi:glutamate synthase domain-containing protein 3
VAAAILADWGTSLRQFHRVIPTDYKQVLDQTEQEDMHADEPGADDQAQPVAGH